ncbi:unnamed protein product, partial [marine sediment metagenome]
MSAAAKKILIVDDEDDITILTEKFLQLENYETITSSNGYDALDIIKENMKKFHLYCLI